MNLFGQSIESQSVGCLDIRRRVERDTGRRIPQCVHVPNEICTNNSFDTVSHDQHDTYETELNLLLDLFLFRLSVIGKDVTYGGILQNLRYDFGPPSHRSRKLMALLSLQILLPYLMRKISKRAQSWVAFPSHDRRKKFWTLLTKLEVAYKCATFVNLLIFLSKGIYPTLIHRLLAIRLVQNQMGPRTVSFDFMNRQLLWNGFSECTLHSFRAVSHLPSYVLCNASRTWSLIVGRNVNDVCSAMAITKSPMDACLQVQ